MLDATDEIAQTGHDVPAFLPATDARLTAPSLGHTLPPPSATSPFHSFFMGGFECATHGRRDRQRIDVTRSTRHDLQAGEDYRLLAACGIRTVRDGLRWHLIEQEPGVYDWSSFLPMLRAAQSMGTQVIWDLCHWGLPRGLDPFAPDFPARFAAFARAAAALVRSERELAGVPGPALYCAVNEISFWAWVGGDERHFFPYAVQRGPELKRQLVHASIAAIHAVREVDPTARFVQAEPAVQIAGDAKRAIHSAEAAIYTAAQFEAWDMLAGLGAPELGGAPEYLDIVGVNFYWNNEWVHKAERTPPGHPLHKPLHQMLSELFERYNRPVLLTETGAEAAAAVGWLGYVAAELRQAQRLGVPVLGLCLYPVMDYPGWDDGRHCPCGLIAVADDWHERTLREDLRAELAIQQQMLAAASHTQVPAL